MDCILIFIFFRVGSSKGLTRVVISLLIVSFSLQARSVVGPVGLEFLYVALSLGKRSMLLRYEILKRPSTVHFDRALYFHFILNLHIYSQKKQWQWQTDGEHKVSH